MEQTSQFVFEKRSYPRITANFPILVSGNIDGKIINLSETSACFLLRGFIPSKIFSACINIGSNSLEFKIGAVWTKSLVEEAEVVYGVQFLKMDNNVRSILRKVLIYLAVKETIKNLEEEETKRKILRFFTNYVRLYVEKIIELTQEIDFGTCSQEEAEKTFFFLTDNIMQKAEELERVITQRVILKKIRQTFRKLVSSWIYKGNIVKRALNKPRGYPGDYATLEMIYNNQSLSERIGRCSDKYFLENEYAIAVKNRREKMKELLADFIKNSNLPSINILNLGCGSSREVKELLFNCDFINKKQLNFILIDQDQEALDFSKESLKEAPPNIKFKFLKQDILSLLKNETCKDELGIYSLIYSIGLADYLPDRLLKRLMQFCIGLLSVGGNFIIAHKDIGRCDPVHPNWFCNWRFYSRNENDLINLVKAIDISNFKIDMIVREQSERILFLTVKRCT